MDSVIKKPQSWDKVCLCMQVSPDIRLPDIQIFHCSPCEVTPSNHHLISF